MLKKNTGNVSIYMGGGSVLYIVWMRVRYFTLLLLNVFFFLIELYCSFLEHLVRASFID